MRASVRQAASPALLLTFMACSLLLSGLHDDVKNVMAAGRDKALKASQTICWNIKHDHLQTRQARGSAIRKVMKSCKKCCALNNYKHYYLQPNHLKRYCYCTNSLVKARVTKPRIRLSDYDPFSSTIRIDS